MSIPRVMRPYVVQQGDYLTKLAHVYGFDAAEVWNHPANEAIRGLRPNMLTDALRRSGF